MSMREKKKLTQRVQAWEAQRERKEQRVKKLNQKILAEKLRQEQNIC